MQRTTDIDLPKNNVFLRDQYALSENFSAMIKEQDFDSPPKPE